MKAVMVPIAHGYGSTTRLLAVAKALRARGDQVVFAAGESLRGIINEEGFELSPILSVRPPTDSSVPSAVYVLRQEAANGFLRQQAKDVRGVIRDFKADVVIFSQNNTAAVAASAEGLPSVSIFHPTIMQFHDWDTFVALFLNWRKFFALRKTLDLKRPVPSSILGDLNFIPSIPPLIYWPFIQPPEIYFRKRPVKTIGALARTRPEDLPDREMLRKEMGVGAEPFIYATVGGATVDVAYLRTIVAGMRLTGCQALVTAGSTVSDDMLNALSTEQVKLVRFLPQPMRAIKACDLLLWHGGHETMLEAVTAARPAVGIPYQFDQAENTARYERAGAGIRIDREKVSPDNLAQAIIKVLSTPSFAENAQRLKLINDSLGGIPRLLDSVDALLAYGRSI